MIPDSYQKTLRIPVRLRDGHFQLFHGGALPKIKVGAVAALIIESHNFEDSADVARMKVHKTIPLLPKGSTLMARLSKDYCENTQGLVDDIKMDPLLGYPVAFAPIQLKEDLDLTLASRHYETRRRSNGGNVFLSVYFETDKIWRPLKDLRFKHEVEFETEIARRNGELGL